MRSRDLLRAAPLQGLFVMVVLLSRTGFVLDEDFQIHDPQVAVFRV